MPLQQELECWQEEVSSAFVHLLQTQAQVLGLSNRRCSRLNMSRGVMNRPNSHD